MPPCEGGSRKFESCYGHMLPEASKFSPGTVAIFTDHIARYSDFTVSLTMLKIPQGSHFMWARGVYLAYNFNHFAREMQGDWLFLMDDDHRFDPDLLMRLLAHDKDVVVGLTSKKFPPYDPVLYRKGNGDASDLGLESIDLTGKSGLIEVDACGKPGMLIKRNVLDAIPDPWCEFRDSEQGAEDLDLCLKIREAGFKIYADLDTPVSHMVPMAVTKVQSEGVWGTLLAVGEGKDIFLPDSMQV